MQHFFNAVKTIDNVCVLTSARVVNAIESGGRNSNNRASFTLQQWILLSNVKFGKQIEQNLCTNEKDRKSLGMVIPYFFAPILR